MKIIDLHSFLIQKLKEAAKKHKERCFALGVVSTEMVQITYMECCYAEGALKALIDLSLQLGVTEEEVRKICKNNRFLPIDKL